MCDARRLLPRRGAAPPLDATVYGKSLVMLKASAHGNVKMKGAKRRERRAACWCRGDVALGDAGMRGLGVRRCAGEMRTAATVPCANQHHGAMRYRLVPGPKRRRARLAALFAPEKWRIAAMRAHAIEADARCRLSSARAPRLRPARRCVLSMKWRGFARNVALSGYVTLADNAPWQLACGIARLDIDEAAKVDDRR